ncbi:MAG: zinc ribbon domain-containing protein [Candidatus Heimdallarchaeota archaeon]
MPSPFLAIILLLASTIVALIGIYGAWMGLISTRWPDVNGVLDSYSIHKTAMETNNQPRYRADLFLSFKLGRETFKTKKKTAKKSSTPAVKHEIERKFPDSQATLFYNPYNPNQCVLEPGVKGYWVIPPVAALILAYGGAIAYSWPIELGLFIIGGVGSLVVLNFLVFFGGHNNPDAEFWDDVQAWLETNIFGPPPARYRKTQRKPEWQVADASAARRPASKAKAKLRKEVVEVRCSGCGAKRRKTAKFCSQCGAETILKQVIPPQIDVPEVPEEGILSEIEIEENSGHSLPSDITTGSTIATLELFTDYDVRNGEIDSESGVDDQLSQLEEVDVPEAIPSSEPSIEEASSQMSARVVSPALDEVEDSIAVSAPTALDEVEDSIAATAPAVLEDAEGIITTVVPLSPKLAIEDVQPRFSTLQYQVREIIFEEGVFSPIARLFPYSGAMEEIAVEFEETQIKMSGCLSRENLPSVDLELNAEGEPQRLPGFDLWQTITLTGDDRTLKRLKLRRGIARKMVSLGTVTVKVDSPLLDKICIQIVCTDSKDSIARSYALMKEIQSFLEYSLQ